MDRILAHQIKNYLKSFLRPINLMSIPQVIDKPPADAVLVLSPHFDDDILGCGGTLYKHVGSGDRVTIVYLTDGREGNPACADKLLVERTRKEEARRATSLLGITDLVFLDQPETKLKPTGDLIEKLAEIISHRKPNVIYIPSFMDNHIDHMETNRVFLSLSSAINLECNVCAYEVWTPLLPNITVDITDIWTKKKESLNQYVSQIKQVDYVSTILALNRYRSIANLQGHGYAEAFLYTSAQEYIRVLKHLHFERRSFVDRELLRHIRKFRKYV